MKFNLIKQGLQKLIDEDINVEEAKQAIAEIDEMTEKLGKYNDTWSDECYLLSADTVCDVMIEVTYDKYAELYKAANKRVDFEEYKTACCSLLGLEYAPLSMIEVGFDIVSDLYRDNEANGCHEPTGEVNDLKSFCRAVTNFNVKQEYLEEYGPEETKRLYAEHLYNLMIDCGVDTTDADKISDKLSDIDCNIKEHFTADGLNVLKEIINEQLSIYLEATEDDAYIEPANQRLNVLSTLLDIID